MKTTFATRAAGAVLVPLMMFGASAALADPDHAELPDFGQVGDVSHVDQVIEVDMGEMYFDPDAYTFERGETVKFMLVNSGRAVHEFAIGTEETHNAHEQEMKAMLRSGMMTTRVLRHDRMLEAGMMHVDANARLLEPDETSELVWTFSGEQDELIIACNIPGHRAAGMKAVVTIGEEHSG
jgi:uncharacterized cupredoxin-like copper-binding protein